MQPHSNRHLGPRVWSDKVCTIPLTLHAQVLKQLNAPFTPLIGQLVLEAFTFDEGTYPATACDFVAKTVFPEQVCQPTAFQHIKA